MKRRTIHSRVSLSYLVLLAIVFVLIPNQVSYARIVPTQSTLVTNGTIQIGTFPQENITNTAWRIDTSTIGSATVNATSSGFVGSSSATLSPADGWTVAYDGDADDDYTEIPFGFNISFNGVQYSSVFVGSNTYLTFGGGSYEYGDLTASNPNLPGVHIGAGDHSYQKVFYKLDDANTMRVRYEGTNDTGGINGFPNIVYETVFYKNKAYFDLYVGVHSNTILQDDSVSATYGDDSTVTLDAYLYDWDWNPISGKDIIFSLRGSVVGTATTDADGYASVVANVVGRPAVGSYYWDDTPPGVQVSFAGDTDYDAASGTADLTITKREIRLEPASDTKSYDGLTTAAGVPTIWQGSPSTSLASGDVATFTETYDNSAIGTFHFLTPSGGTVLNSLGVDVSANYSISQASKLLPMDLYESVTAIIGDYIYSFAGMNTNAILRAPISDPTYWINTGATMPGFIRTSQLAVIGDYVYIFGGRDDINGSKPTNIIYRAPLSNPTVWTDTGVHLPGNLSNSQLATISDYVYLFGGNLDLIGGYGGATSTIYRAPLSNPTSWVNTGATLPGALSHSQLATIGDYVYLFGGKGGTGKVIYRAPLSNPTSWVNTGATIPSALQESKVATIGDYVYLFGGNNGGATSTIYRAPLSNPTSWVNTGATLPGVLRNSQLAIIGDFVYLFAGYRANYNSTNTIFSAPITNPLHWTSSPSIHTGTITQKALTVSGITASNKNYDGNTSATISVGSAALVGVVGSESVTLNTGSAVGTFDNANSGTGKTVTISGLTISGSNSGNYTLTATTTTASIIGTSLTASGITASNKTYDGNTSATIDVSGAALSGVVEGDHVTLNTGSAVGTFDTASVGTGKTVTISGLTLSGADAGKYTISSLTTTANISAKALTVSGITANNKIYDGSIGATLSVGSAALVGVVSPDVVTLNTGSAAGTFDTSAVGTGKTVTISGLTISGASASNYTLTQSTTTANITATPPPPTVSTEAASSLSTTGATLNGTITATGGLNVTVRGFAWGTNSALSGGDTATTTDTVGQPFSTEAFANTSLTLTCNTTYYSRAYATNSGLNSQK